MTLSIIPFLTASSPAADNNGHKLSKEWKEYRTAMDQDKPKDALKALEAIKKEATRQHLTWDYYDACDKFKEVRVRTNWKLRDSLDNAFRKEIIGFGEPAAVYYMRRNTYRKDLLDYILANEKKLKASKNPEFWLRDWKISHYKFANALRPLLKSDWDYVLWSLFPESRMKEEYGSYPLNAFVDYQAIVEKNDSGPLLKGFAEKYAGTAAALMAEEDLLRQEFNRLTDNKSATSDQFLTFREKCDALVKRGKAFKGDETAIADCCDDAADLISQMDSKSLSFDVEDSSVDFEFKNLESVNIQILKDGSKVWEKLLANPKKSYYVKDALRIDLPDLADGIYKIKCTASGIDDETREWTKYTISASSRWNADGLGIWAADFMSGEPLAKVNVELIRNGKVTRTLKDFQLDGFTNLPADVSEYISKESCTLRLRSGDRASREIRPGSYYADDLEDRARQQCIVLTDRSAFQPDETVFFKAVLYRGRYTIKANEAGEKVTAVLKDARGDELERLELTTNENGSVAGSFVLRRTERNGQYSIEILRKGIVEGRKHVLVDDFVLPTFDLTFDKLPELHYPIDSVTIKGTVMAYSGHSLSGAKITYTVSHNGFDYASGKLSPEKNRFAFTFPVVKENPRWGDRYAVRVRVTDVTGETMDFEKWVFIQADREPEYDIDYYFKDISAADGSDLAIKAVAGKKVTWAAVELYGTGDKLLERKVIRFAPQGDGYATAEVRYPYLDSYPQTMSLQIVYFQNKRVYSHSVSRRRENHAYDMPLSFERFLDTTSPGAHYTFTIKTGPGAEVAATIFDKSTERFMPNSWVSVKSDPWPVPYISYSNYPGVDEGRYEYVMAYGRNVLSKAAGRFDEVEMMVEEAAVDAPMADSVAGVAPEAEAEDIPIREDFATTIAWEPFLKADKDGTVQFSFTNADKLSTFFVQLFSHDKDMRNETLRREMVVTIPVKISLVEPKFIYEGDKWNVRVGLSSTLIGDADGTLQVDFIDGASYKTGPVLSSSSKTVKVPGGGSCSFDFPVTAPAVDVLGLKITFKPTTLPIGSDAVFVTVPVRKAVQTLTESHSGVLLQGASAQELEASLRDAFVNVPGSEASLRDISILGMIREALPEKITPDAENAISLSEALYAKSLCDRLGQEVEFDGEGIISKLLALQGEDGGFSWFKGMSSSPMVTTIVLERMRGLGIIDEEAAVHFLDKEFFESHSSSRWWYCGISMQQYLYVRSLFPEVSFNEKTTRDFRKEVRAYLVPSKERGLNGWLFAKTRRLATLKNLSELEGGTSLARTMGIRLMAAGRLRRSLKADVESLVQYAEPHKDGGIYYPNLVMPWRGLLETELYAHSRLCNLLATSGHNDISDGIRLWIMLQKETQHWEDDPGYIEAIASVMDASQAVLDTRVLALSAEYTKPFSEIIATGNGMVINREPIEYSKPSGEWYYRGSVSGGLADSLKVGDRIRIRWSINNEENRSFVRITLPHNAGLVPVDQTSGYHYGCYRNVLADRIELWYESYPEEKTEVYEEYYVTRSGAFQCPAAVVESLYAPHYRANTAAPETLEIEN